MSVQELPDLIQAVYREFDVAEDDRVRTWLAMELAFNRQHNRNGGGRLHYLGPQHLVLAEGRHWRSPAEEDRDYPDGQPKNCFQDAMTLALLHRDLTYVEGYAWCGVMVCPHAWVVKPDGDVLDVTWRDSVAPGKRPPREEWRYVGIPFDYKVAWQHVRRNDEYGIIDAWAHGYPLCQRPLPRSAIAEEWR